MIRVRSVLGGLLALILMVGSVVGAYARHEQAGLTMVTLCGTDGALVLINAQGNPVKARHACPECVAAAAAVTLVGTPDVLALARVARVAFHPAAVVPMRQSDTLTPVARGPPDQV